MKIGVVGSTNVDYVLRVDRFVQVGETIKARSFHKFPGGKGANQAVAAAKLSESSVIFSSFVGEDEDGKWMLKRFSELKIIGPKAIEGYTGKAFIEVTSSGENRITIYTGTNSKLTPEKLDYTLLEKVEIVLLQNEIPFQTTLNVARWAKNSGKIVVFDPAPAHEIDPEIFKYVDYITPNEVELMQLSRTLFGEIKEVRYAAEKLLEMGAGSVIVKLGENGVYYRKGLKEVKIPALRVEVLDTTAAGDVFNGAFAAFYDLGEMRALELAVKAASISVTKMGAQSSIPDREEVIR